MSVYNIIMLIACNYMCACVYISKYVCTNTYTLINACINMYISVQMYWNVHVIVHASGRVDMCESIVSVHTCRPAGGLQHALHF
jgi:hypothetical protein